MKWTTLTPYSGWEFNTEPFPEKLSSSTNIKEIHLNFTMQYNEGLAIQGLYDICKIWTGRLQSIQKLSLALVAPKDDYVPFTGLAVSVVSSNLGIQYKKEVRTRTRYVVPGCVDIEWTWQAKEDEILVWTAAKGLDGIA
jgi:hypothetical protein